MEKNHAAFGQTLVDPQKMPPFSQSGAEATAIQTLCVVGNCRDRAKRLDCGRITAAFLRERMQSKELIRLDAQQICG
jgi:hypothetical protein